MNDLEHWLQKQEKQDYGTTNWDDIWVQIWTGRRLAFALIRELAERVGWAQAEEAFHQIEKETKK